MIKAFCDNCGKDCGPVSLDLLYVDRLVNKTIPGPQGGETHFRTGFVSIISCKRSFKIRTGVSEYIDLESIESFKKEHIALLKQNYKIACSVGCAMMIDARKFVQGQDKEPLGNEPA